MTGTARSGRSNPLHRHQVRVPVPPAAPMTAGSRPHVMPQAMCYIVSTMNNKVGIRELRQQASAVLRRVVDGEVIEVTDHGHPIARIVPLRLGVLDQLVLEGRATGASDDLLDLMGSLDLPAAGEADGRPPSLALAELRSDER